MAENKLISRRREDSIYPIKAGNVLLPDKHVFIFNPKLKEKAMHRLYIWVLTESAKRKRGQPPKRRKVKVFYYYEPVEEIYKDKYIMNTLPKAVQFETVAKYLRSGFKLLGEGIRYNYRLEDIIPFYRIIGVMDEN